MTLSRSTTSGRRALTGTVYVMRQVHFNAAHRLHNPDKSAAWNKATFGPCNNAKWHGHNYVLEVTVAGKPDPGYVIDLVQLKDVLEARVLKDCDHRNLNEEVKWLRGVISSAENLAIAFCQRIEPALPADRLHNYIGCDCSRRQEISWTILVRKE